MKKQISIITALLLAAIAGAEQMREYEKPNAVEVPELQNVKIKGPIGEKMNTFFQNRIFSDCGKYEVFAEAERAFTNPQDDAKKAVGVWQGEFWGKLAISASRVYDYSQNPELKKFLRESTQRIMDCQQADGYIGSYQNKLFLKVTDLEAAKKVMNWRCNWCWNLWCRKYTLWGMLEVYRITNDKNILDSAKRSMDQYIDMLKSNNIKICDTGTFEGMPSMSILKPLLVLYRYTDDNKYLDFAKEIVSYWDRDGNPAPNFLQNAFSDKPVHEWYPNPERWAKAYEMMSCLQGLVEYYRVTGDKKSLDAVVKIHEKLWRNERNLLSSVGYNDMFSHAAAELNGVTEPCDAIHWMRLTHELFLVTADPKYMDIFEETFYNAFLAGVYRDGKWGARGVRSHGRSFTAEIQADFMKNHCCVNNMPRGFMDMAQSVATFKDDTIYINLYNPYSANLKDAKVDVSDGYLQYGKAVVSVSSKTPKNVMLRIPAWSRETFVNGEPVKSGGWHEIKNVTNGNFDIKFDNSARVVNSELPSRQIDKKSNSFRRWIDKTLYDTDVMRNSPAATIRVGPLLLARSKYMGNTQKEMFESESVNNKNASCKLTPLRSDTTMCGWIAEIKTPDGKTVKTNVCDLSSAGDKISIDDEKFYSIFF